MPSTRYICTYLPSAFQDLSINNGFPALLFMLKPSTYLNYFNYMHHQRMNLDIFRIWRLIQRMSTWSYWERQSSLWPSQKDTLQKFLGWQSTSWGQMNGHLLESLLLELKSIWSASKKNIIVGIAFLWIVPLLKTLLETLRELFLSWLDMVMPEVPYSSGKLLCFSKKEPYLSISLLACLNFEYGANDIYNM